MQGSELIFLTRFHFLNIDCEVLGGNIYFWKLWEQSPENWAKMSGREIRGPITNIWILTSKKKKESLLPESNVSLKVHLCQSGTKLHFSV